MKGFVTPDFIDQMEPFMKDVGQWIKEGKVKYQETIHQGIDNAPQAFIDLFSGGNEGKMLVQLAEQ